MIMYDRCDTDVNIMHMLAYFAFFNNEQGGQISSVKCCQRVPCLPALVGPSPREQLVCLRRIGTLHMLWLYLDMETRYWSHSQENFGYPVPCLFKGILCPYIQAQEQLSSWRGQAKPRPSIQTLEGVASKGLAPQTVRKTSSVYFDNVWLLNHS